MTNKKTTIRTSPTINKICYDIYGTYGIPISNFLERGAMEIVYNDKKLKNELWCEIKVKEELIKRYKEDKRIINRTIDKRISTLEDEINVLKEGMTESIQEETSKNIQGAHQHFLRIVKEERLKKEKSDKENYRYDIKKISEETVFEICDLYHVTPKMILPLLPRKIIERFFDEKCKKYRK